MSRLANELRESIVAVRANRARPLLQSAHQRVLNAMAQRDRSRHIADDDADRELLRALENWFDISADAVGLGSSQ